MDPAYFPLKEVLRFGIVLFRVSGVFLFAPLFGSRSIPMQFKAVLALLTTAALLPTVPLEAVPDEFGLGSLFLCAVGQLMIGMVLGMAASFVFAGLQLAGQLISFQLGFAIINLIDPQSDVEMTVFSFLENFLGLLFFLLINGHHWFFLAISESYRSLPVQGVTLQGPLVGEMVRLSSGMLVAAVQIAGPVIAVTALMDIVLGIIGRVAPQIHILIVGMPLKTLIGFGCLSFSFYFLPQWLARSFIELQRTLFNLAHALR
jgi:flagellar biosynthesis protein FliR